MDGFTDRILAHKGIIANITSLLTRIESSFTKLKLLNHQERGSQCFRILLCVRHIQKLLLFLNKLDKWSAGASYKIMNFLSSCIGFCSKKIDILLNNEIAGGSEVMNTDINENDGIVLSKDECLGRFINKLDTLLLGLARMTEAEVNEMDIYNTNYFSNELKVHIDDLLLQAVTVAKILGGTDSSEITATCLKVLKECKIIESSCNNLNPKESIASLNLHCELLVGNLMQLERKVSSALLRLMLKVFSDVQRPLKHLIHSLDISSMKDGKSRLVSDLDKLVEEFDYHNESVQNLCLFALGFSDDEKCVLDINCCLLSIESLESYLVPAVLDLYIDHLNGDKLHYLKFLVEYWLSEVNNLESLLDTIIDPTSFTMVTLQSVQSDLERAKNITKSELSSRNTSVIDLSAFNGILNNIITQVDRLSRHLKYCNDTDLMCMKKCLKSVTNECRHVLIKASSIEDNKQSIVGRTLKRFDYLVSTVEKISCHLYSSRSNDCNIQFTSFTNKCSRNPSSVSDMNLCTDFIYSKIGRSVYADKNSCNTLSVDGYDNDNNSDYNDIMPVVDQLKLKSFTFINTVYEPSPRKNKCSINRGRCAGEFET
ncbi:uncharacterized protein LOC142324422 isoform X2 [Lycorma delicatula]|uniref:uncharacterized protein LOC142324422 isoform X2 n=1 Tax=Lycorma delicatula TaxID=130591 RepID=UPI003F510066